MTRNFTGPFLIVCLTCLCLTASASAQTPANADDPLAAMYQIRAAAAKGDAQLWNQLVAEDAVFVEPNGRIEKRDYHRPKAATASPKVTSTLSETQVRDLGTAAVVTYREDLAVDPGGQTRSAMRYSEIYKRSSGRWMLAYSAEVPIPLRFPVKVDPAKFTDYIGEYQVTPEVIGKVYLDGDKLMLLGTGWKRPYQLQPLTESNFFFVEAFENTEISFARDCAGKVVSQVTKANSHEMVAKKIK